MVKVGDIVVACRIDIQGRGTGKPHQAKVIRLYPEREEVQVKWVGEEKYSILNLWKIRSHRSIKN